jgi:hypothetical protein
VLIAQLSDLHVRPKGELLYGGIVDSNRALADAIERVLAIDLRPDLVVFTGDLVDEGRPEEYAMLREIPPSFRFLISSSREITTTVRIFEQRSTTTPICPAKVSCTTASTTIPCGSSDSTPPCRARTTGTSMPTGWPGSRAYCLVTQPNPLC